jgi:hypothetical protein
MSFNKEFLKRLRNERKSYKDMIEFCCDNLIMNNYIIEELAKKDIFFETYSGEQCYYIDKDGNDLTRQQAEEMDFNDYEECYVDIYQYFIIDGQAADRLAEYTNEIVLYNEDLDMYLLCVSHYGSSWSDVSANWKELDEGGEDE